MAPQIARSDCSEEVREEPRCVGKESAESDNYMDFPVVMYGYERWTIRKAEH